MVQTVKFSQFLIGGDTEAGDIIVGLRDGKNYQFNAPTGNGGTSTIISQDLTLYPVAVGQWLRVNSSGIYVPALADSAENAEVVGLCVLINDLSHFTIQIVGYVSSAQNVFAAAYGNLTIGQAYFLSPSIAGSMQLLDIYQFGYVSKPVFVADGIDSGWILDYRGLIVGDEGHETCPCVYTSIVMVVQDSHGFATGNWVYLTASKTYALASATSIASSQEVGCVTNVLNGNSFVLQFAGYNQGSVSVNDAGSPIVASDVYYLSATSPGNISTTNPSSGGNISRPVYISEQVYGTTGLNAGYILNQRSLNLAQFGTGSNDFPMALLFGR